MRTNKKLSLNVFSLRSLSSSVLLTLAGLTLAAAPLKADEIVYVQRYLNTPWTNRPIAAVGLDAYYRDHTTKLGVALDTYSSSDGVQIYNFWGYGPLPHTTGPGTLTAQSWFPEMIYSVVGTVGSPVHVNSITWDMAASSITQEARILVQSNGKWYASNDVFTTDVLITNNEGFRDQTSGGAAIGKSFNFEAGITLWREAFIGVGESMLLSDTQTVLSSNLIEGIGFYLHNNENPREWLTQKIFIDNLVAYGTVPEPTTVATALAGVALLAAGILRRRSR